jgi:hypothetical protein
VDNLFFGASEHRPLVVVDWQGALCSWSGAYDAAYLISTGMSIEDRRAHGAELLRTYYDTLVASGVDDYRFDEFEDDCRGSLLAAFAVIGVIAGGMLDVVEDIYSSLINEKSRLKHHMASEDITDMKVIYNVFLNGEDGSRGFYRGLSMFYDMSSYVITKDTQYLKDYPSVKQLIDDIKNFIDEVQEKRAPKNESTVKRAIKLLDDYLPHVYRKNIIMIVPSN